MSLVLLLLGVACLAYANGANDNFKGVATLFGSGTTNYRRALIWATLTTLLGSITAVYLAKALLHSFSGQGLFEDLNSEDIGYGAAVALGAGVTVLLATRVGMPISTTHSLVGALVGAGWAAGSAVNFVTLRDEFFAPLLISPLVAFVAAGLCYRVFHWSRRRLGVSEAACLCVGSETIEVLPTCSPAVALQRVNQLTVSLGETVTCERRYQGRILGLQASWVLDRLHFLSAGVVSFARGLNDTPKIAAVLLLTGAINPGVGIALIGLIIAAGGLLSAKKVAQTMSQRITAMNHGQGFTANLITGLVVIGASRLGMPVSTTHVSCGGLFGIGVATRQGNARTIGVILAAWLVTLPLGALLGAVSYWLIHGIRP